MTAPKERLVGAARQYLGPVARRLGVRREMLELAPGQRAQMAALLEQALRAQERLEAYIDRVKEEQAAQSADVDLILLAARSIVDALGSEHGPAGAGDALTGRLDHAMNHADAEAARTRLHVDRELAALRGTVRLTQSLVERALQSSAGDGPAEDGIQPVTPAPRVAPDEAGSATAAKQFRHDVPTFDSLYRAFEDRHRGDPEAILDRQREDYLELLSALPNPDLPIVDLGCGRGELVGLLQTTGHDAIGVDSNLGQVVDATGGTFHQGDLFDWLDQQDDASCRAVVSMHVVEHLPLDLQIRLVFEAHRVLADGGALVLETPNTLSINIGASNFWVDPTHERPVHPLFLEFLAIEAGFAEHETRFLHPIPLSFPSNEATAALVADLDSLILGPGDLALVARR